MVSLACRAIKEHSQRQSLKLDMRLSGRVLVYTEVLGSIARNTHTHTHTPKLMNNAVCPGGASPRSLQLASHHEHSRPDNRRRTDGIRLLFLKDNRVREGNKQQVLSLISGASFCPEKRKRKKCHPPSRNMGHSYKNCHCPKSCKRAIPAATTSSLTSFPLI